MTTTMQNVERPLTQEVRDLALSGEVVLPPLPEVAHRVIELLSDLSKADYRMVADVLHSDPAITAVLLRMANSAFFGGLQPISDPGQALARLGVKRVVSLVTTLATKGQFEIVDPFKTDLLRGLWTHSVGSGLAARRLAGLTGGDAEESYLAGLLHDIGKLLALKTMDHLSQRRPEIELSPIIMSEVLQACHAELGHRVLTDWHLPSSICQAVLVHHDDTGTIRDGLAMRVQAADAITRKIGAHPKPDPNLVLEDLPAIERLGLSDLELAALMVDLEDEIANLQRLL